MARVLIGDNCADTADSTAMLLRQWGHEVQIFTNGPSLLQAARTHPADVVLMDVVLRGLDGFEVARQLRQDTATHHLRLVAITGYGREGDRQRARKAGFDLHLVKPVEPEFLRQLLALHRSIT